MIHVFYEKGGDGKIKKVRLELDDEMRPLVVRVLEALAIKLEGEAPPEIAANKNPF